MLACIERSQDDPGGKYNVCGLNLITYTLIIKTIILNEI